MKKDKKELIKKSVMEDGIEINKEKTLFFSYLPLFLYLSDRKEGHLLAEEERIYYRVTDKKFGDYLYILKEGTCFSNNWFGKSFKKHNPNGSGMHGFWPEWSAYDQLASIILINGKRQIQERYTYPEAHKLIKEIMLMK